MASIEEQPARLVIDSGDGSAATLFTPYVEKTHLRDRFKQRVQTRTGKGLGGANSADVVRVPSLTLGSMESAEGEDPQAKRQAADPKSETLTLHGAVTHLSRQTQGGFATDTASGQIGTGILDRFVVTFDYPHARLILTPNSHLNDPFVYNREGYGTDEQGGKYVAVAVLPGGPAAQAGLQDGDVILSIDEVAIDAIMAKEDDLYANRPVGAVRRVVYQRGNQKPVEAKVKLREMLP